MAACVALLIGAGVVLAGSVRAAEAAPDVPEGALTEQGKALEAEYAGHLSRLKAEIEKGLPPIDAAKRDAFLAAYEAESVARSTWLGAQRSRVRRPAGDPAHAAYETANQVLEAAAAKAAPLADTMLAGLNPLLTSDERDAALVRYVLLTQATPTRLAAFAQQGKEQKALIDTLLGNVDLMKQMVVADGAADGNYGRAMEIYTAIQATSDKTGEGVLQRLALATALEHATPIGQQNAAAQPDSPATVAPLKRYLHFEQAYLDGELDPGFKDLSVWDYRMVVNGEEPEEILTWGRQMLRNYRPDHISMDDYRWRYVNVVKTDVRYGSHFNSYDKPELQFFQNILMNGGVCGRRAFFGRFILRAFGVPTTARPQRAHAALAHWTPDGWVVCLGASWTWGWTATKYREDLDYLANTQARMTGEPFVQALRARWIGTVLGEPESPGFHGESSGFWNGVALYKQRRIIEAAEAVTLAAVGEDIGEANESKVKDAIAEVVLTEADRAIVIDSKGVITIPAAACSRPTQNTGKILFMDSVLGGKQLHYSRIGDPEDFEYTIEVPKAGTYSLRAKLVSPSWGQMLLVTVNSAEKPIEIKVPLTVGMWETTAPVKIDLVKGRNVLTFSRASETIDIRGLSIREFTLIPE